jgi:lipopolysaccharide export system permease protein
MRVGGLQLFGKVDRYVGSLFVGAYATSVLLIVGLAVILDLASNLRFFETWADGTEPPTGWVLRYCALNTPFLYLRVAPFVTTAAALFTVAKLIRHNELVACLNAGISARRVLLPIFLGAVAAGLLMIALREGATKAIGDQRDALRDTLSEQRLERVITNVRFRDISDNYFGMREFHPGLNEARGFTVDMRRGATDISISAEAAKWEEGPDGRMHWRLIEGEYQEFTGDVSTTRVIDRLENLEITPEDILLSDKSQDPERSADLSFAELDELSRRDPSNLEYQTLFHAQLTFPLANVVLLLIALPFLFGRERGKNVEGLVLACLMCVLYFAVDFVCRSLGMEGAWPPLWAAWSPVLVFASLGAVLLEGLRT